MNLNITEIAKAIKGEILKDKNTDTKDIIIKNIITDSREVLNDSLFFALKGEIFDGHDFTHRAVENGVIAIVVNKDYALRENLSDNTIVIAVEDTGLAFLDLAKYYKSLFELEFTVGITGSNGKTTVKEFTHAVLSQKYKARKTEGNFNNEVGMPKTIFNLQQDERVLVLEMGMNHFGEISRLSKSAEPDIGIVNNIGTNHIENLGSREGIKQAKCEIMDGMSANSTIILNADEPLLYCEKGKTGKREVFFGIENRNADVIAADISYDYDANVSFFEIDGTRFKIPVVGLHNVYNAIPAYICGKICGLSDEMIQAGYNNFENVKMRQNIYEFHGITIIDDCYNASLESVRAGLAVLAQMPNTNNQGKKIAVLSDVLECGDFADDIHTKIGEALLENNIDVVYAYGDKSKHIADVVAKAKGACFYFEDKAHIAEKLFEEAKNQGTVVLFKASRGMAIETVLEDFKKLF